MSCFQWYCEDQIIISLVFQDPVLYLKHGECSVYVERQRGEEEKVNGVTVLDGMIIYRF